MRDAEQKIIMVFFSLETGNINKENWRFFFESLYIYHEQKTLDFPLLAVEH